MVRRTAMVLWLLSIATLVYALLAWGVFRRVMLTFVKVICLHGEHKWVPRPDEDVIFGISPSDIPAHIQIAGVPVPLSVLVVTFLTIQAFPFLCAFMNRRRRRLRYLHDECIECGRPITSWHGRCPGCGMRIGPDAAGRYTLRSHG
jgi:hypothetical protein